MSIELDFATNVSVCHCGRIYAWLEGQNRERRCDECAVDGWKTAYRDLTREADDLKSQLRSVKSRYTRLKNKKEG